jgi:hypothetical protein
MGRGVQIGSICVVLMSGLVGDVALLGIRQPVHPHSAPACMSSVGWRATLTGTLCQ